MSLSRTLRSPIFYSCNLFYSEQDKIRPRSIFFRKNFIDITSGPKDRFQEFRMPSQEFYQRSCKQSTNFLFYWLPFPSLRVSDKLKQSPFKRFRFYWSNKTFKWILPRATTTHGAVFKVEINSDCSRRLIKHFFYSDCFFNNLRR